MLVIKAKCTTKCKDGDKNKKSGGNGDIRSTTLRIKWFVF